MQKVTIVACGTKNEAHWIKIQKAEGLFLLNAFINVSKAQKVGAVIEMPDSIYNAIQWRP